MNQLLIAFSWCIYCLVFTTSDDEDHERCDQTNMRKQTCLLHPFNKIRGRNLCGHSKKPAENKGKNLLETIQNKKSSIFYEICFHIFRYKKQFSKDIFIYNISKPLKNSFGSNLILIFVVLDEQNCIPTQIVKYF